MGKRYLVTGAAGHLGSTILRTLKDTEDEAVGLLLPSEHPSVEGENIRYVHGDVRQPESLRQMFQGAEDRELVVIHTAGIISISAKLPPELRSVNVDGVKNMLQLSREHAASRFVYVSSVHAIPELPTPQIMREVDHFSPLQVEGGYAKTKAEASQLVLDAAEEGVPAVIVHPSGILGPYDRGKNHLIQLVADYIQGRLSVCVTGGYDFVDVRDVAQGCLAAAKAGTPGQCYILSGHYLSILDLLTRIGKYCGKKPPSVAPRFLAEFASPLIEWHAKCRGTRPLYTRYALKTLAANGHYCNQKAQTELGFRPREAEDTISDMTQWLIRPPEND